VAHHRDVAPEVLSLAALAVLLLVGVVTPGEAFSGFANEGVVTVAILYVVVSGLRETGGVRRLSRAWLARPPAARHRRRLAARHPAGVAVLTRPRVPAASRATSGRAP
jgi:multisubunit Na+/H+ antiporter MnhB subunit